MLLFTNNTTKWCERRISAVHRGPLHRFAVPLPFQGRHYSKTREPPLKGKVPKAEGWQRCLGSVLLMGKNSLPVNSNPKIPPQRGGTAAKLRMRVYFTYS